MPLARSVSCELTYQGTSYVRHVMIKASITAKATGLSKRRLLITVLDAFRIAFRRAQTDTALGDSSN